MKNKQIFISVIILIFAGLTALQAQKLYVRENGGTQTEYSLSGIRKLTFPAGNITVHETSGNTDTYSVSGLRYLNFTDLSGPGPGPGPVSSVPTMSPGKVILLTFLFMLLGAGYFAIRKKRLAGRLVSVLLLIGLGTGTAHAQNNKMFIMRNGTIYGTHEINNVDSAIFYGPSGSNFMYIKNGSVTEAQYDMTKIDSAIFYIPVGTVTDIEGNVYTTVTIGTQEWMAENLKTTKYKNGTPIPLVTDDSAWEGLSTSAYCWYKNNRATYGHIYGALYNGYTVETGNLCPTGWHVPSDTEWTIMENYLIANGFNYDGTTSGNKIAKALASDELWCYYSEIGHVGNTDYPEKRNATGFTALPGGFRGFYADFEDVGKYGYWWSATQANATNAWNRYMSCHGRKLARGGPNKRYGLSVRCLRD